MPTTTVLDGDGTDWTAAVRALGARTNNAGTAVIDLAADEDRLINHILAEGFLTTNAFVVQDGASGMQITVGSGTAKADIYVVEGDDVGQHPYLVRMDDAQVTITLDAGGADPRIDEIYLVVRDATYDGGTITEPQLAVRKGDASATPVAPGADAAWDAEVLLATINVAASASTIAAGDITDNRSRSNLAAALRDSLAERFADVAGDTFTGAVIFQALSTFQDGMEGSLGSDVRARTDAPSAWPDGMSWQRVTSATGSWPTSDGWVVNVNFGDEAITTQVFYAPRADGGAPDIYIRRRTPASSNWSSWDVLTSARNPGTWEVDGSTEVASASASTIYSAVASVSLSIPSDWSSWKCVATAHARVSSGTYDAKIRIDGTDSQAIESISTDASTPIIVGNGRRTGMTTTGSRTVSFQVKSLSPETLTDIYLYARAVRTS